MSITPHTLSAIQKAGEAIDFSRQALVDAVTEHAQRVMGAIKHNPTNPDNSKLLEDYKALTELAREVEVAERQFRAIYFSAEKMLLPEVQVLPALGHQTVNAVNVPHVSEQQVQDVVAKPTRMTRKKPKAAKTTGAKVSFKLSKNDQKVFDFLSGQMKPGSWTRLTLQSIAAGAGIPNGSSGAAMSRLLKAKLVKTDGKGQYQLK